MPFSKPVRIFENKPLDYFVTIMFIVVFFCAFFFASFHPMKDTDGNIIYKKMPDGTLRTIPEMNMQVYLAPLILIYELFVICVFPGKIKLRSLPFKWYIFLIRIHIAMKIKEGLDEYRQWIK